MSAKDSLNSLLFALTPDVAVNVAPETALPASSRVVDTNLLKTMTRRSDMAVCAEVSALAPDIASAVTEATSHKPKAQLVFDIGELAERLGQGGSVYLIERHRKRAKNARKMMEQLFVEVDLINAADGVLIKGTGSRPYDHKPDLIQVDVLDDTIGRTYSLQTWPGLFSGDHLDQGTALLIDHLPSIIPDTRLLDVGCGYGPISVVAAGRGAHVAYLDVDATALRMTGQNLAAHGLTGDPLLCADLSELERDTYDYVVSNPPTHAGSDVLRFLFDGMRRAVRSRGHVTIVVRRHLAYEKWIGRHEVVADDGKYKLLRFLA